MNIKIPNNTPAAKDDRAPLDSPAPHDSTAPRENLIRRTTDFALHIVRAYVHPGDTVIDAPCGNGHDTLALARMQPAQVFAFDLQPRAIAATRDLLTKAGFAAEITDLATVPADAPLSTVGKPPNSPVKADPAQDTPVMTAASGGPRITLTCLGHEHMEAFFRERRTAEMTAAGNDTFGTSPSGGAVNGDSVITDPNPLWFETRKDSAIQLPAGFASAVLFNLGYLPGGDKALTTRSDTTLTAVRAALRLLDENGLLCVTMYDGHPAGVAEKRALLDFATGLDPRRYHVSYISMLNQPGHPPEILLVTRKK